jgi:16S rRNA (cytosine967-C5)-methyltransferase
VQLERSRDHADDLLRSERVARLSAQDRDLATALVMGVLRWQILLDKLICGYLARPSAKLDLPIQVALRLGAYQLLWMDRIPVHAAIGESVALCRAAGHEHASRMVNAVLRKIAAGERERPEVVTAHDSTELAKATAHPEWMVKRWVEHFGMEQVKWICELDQQVPETHLRVMDAKAVEEMEAAGVGLADGDLLTCALHLRATTATIGDFLRDGRVRVQDEGSQLVAELAGAGKKILDCCAAPGGKTMIVAENNPDAEIDACDASASRMAAMRQRMAAMNSFPGAEKICTHHADAVEWIGQQPAQQWDLVLVDAPCSGTGTLGRNPEIRHRLCEEDLSVFAERQGALLQAAMNASSRRIIYSTCSLEQEENEQVVAAAVAAHPEWGLRSLSDEVARLQDHGRLTQVGTQWLMSGLQPEGTLWLLPKRLKAGLDAARMVRTDGFFVAMLER